MAKEKKKKLVLLDSHAILHRGYHALPDFRSHSGEPTGALFSLATLIFSIVKTFDPEYIIATYDLPEETFRDEMFKDYKAGRAKADDELIAQIERSKEVLEAFGIPVLSCPGFEADDVIGTIVSKTKDRKDLEVIIASGDMDTLQLVEEGRVSVFTLRKGIKDTVLYDEKKVEERFGFNSKLLPDYKGLRGDPSDNIPGIAGIGEKTATTLISNFGSIEDIYKKLKKNEEAFREVGLKDRIINLLKEGEEEALFSKELGTIRDDAPVGIPLEKSWKEERDFEKADNLFSELEFRSLRERLKEVFGENKKTEQSSLIEEDKANMLSDEELAKTKIALWILDSSKTNPKEEDILAYAKTDNLKEAKNKIFSDLEKEKTLKNIYEEIEIPLLPILRKMHDRGILIDLAYLKDLSSKYHKELDDIESKIWKLAEEEFNIRSPQQLGHILFDVLGLPTKGVKKTSTGAWSTNAKQLEKLKGEHEIIDLLLQHREYQKLLSTYIDNIPEMLGKDGRLHTTFVQTGAATGRLSSQDPNLQNIPIKTELGRNIRKAFVASPGFKLVALDYSQIELRVAAILSGDEKLTKAFTSGDDIHSAVAKEVFADKSDMPDKEKRRRAKVINFGILYGMGANALRDNLGKETTTQAEAKKYLEKYFEKFSGLASYLEKTKKEAKKKGYTETYFGRRRYFPGLDSSIPFIRAAAERQASNAPIQGTASDIIKIAAVSIDKEIKARKLEEKVFPLLQIHDELIFEIKKDLVDEASALIKERMENVLDEEVPIVVDVRVGDSWGDI